LQNDFEVRKGYVLNPLHPSIFIGCPPGTTGTPALTVLYGLSQKWVEKVNK
jgi:hypothetical protein